VCRHLYLDLDLSLNLRLYPVLDRTPFQKPFEKPNPSSFRLLFGFRNRSLSVRVGIAPRPKTLLVRAQDIGNRLLSGRR